MEIKSKELYWYFFLKELLLWYGLLKPVNDNNLSILKSLSLFYLTCQVTSKENDGLIHKGWLFDVVPFGIAERDIYRNIKERNWEYVSIEKIDVAGIYQTDFSGLDSQIKDSITDAVNKLRNKSQFLIYDSASDIVDLIHKHANYINVFNQARKDNTFNKEITINQIVNQEHFYESKVQLESILNLVGDKLKDRVLFPEQVERAKEFLDKLISRN